MAKGAVAHRAVWHDGGVFCLLHMAVKAGVGGWWALVCLTDG